MDRLLRDLVASDNGGIAIEYALLLFILALGIISSVTPLPASLNAIWSNVTTNLN
jgi:Flp pilus assembly pilin Flp